MSIEIKITIPQSEYKDWNDYEIGGSSKVMDQLKIDFVEYCRRNWIENFGIEVSEDV